MIRLHHAGDAFRVSARRIPRGFIVYVTDWGWQPVGFNGRRGLFYGTQKAAINRLVSDHRFRSTP